MLTKEEAKPASEKAEKEESPVKVEDLSPEKAEEIMKSEPAPEGYAKESTLPPVPKEEEKPAEGEEKTKEEESKKEEEEKPSEGEKLKSEEKPKEEEKPDIIDRLETELAKPEGKEDLSGFSKREYAYFQQMRRDRRNRQKAEADRDAARHENIKLKKAAEEKTAEPTEKKDPLAILKDKDPTDFLTVKEVTEILKNVTAPSEPKPKGEEKPSEEKGNPVGLRYLTMCENESRAAHPDDFDSVIELADELVNDDPAQLKVVADAVQNGENPAEVMYQVIRKHPEFEKLHPAAVIRVNARERAEGKKEKSEEKPAKKEEKPAEKSEADKAKEAKAAKAQEELEKNTGKTKTTGHLSSAEGKPAEELSLQEIADMSSLEFAKLPKKVRDKYLRAYG